MTNKIVVTKKNTQQKIFRMEGISAEDFYSKANIKRVIGEIPNVVNVAVRRQELEVTIRSACNWESTETQVLNLVKNHLGWRDAVIVRLSIKTRPLTRFSDPTN